MENKYTTKKLESMSNVSLNGFDILILNGIVYMKRVSKKDTWERMNKEVLESYIEIYSMRYGFNMTGNNCIVVFTDEDDKRRYEEITS